MNVKHWALNIIMVYTRMYVYIFDFHCPQRYTHTHKICVLIRFSVSSMFSSPPTKTARTIILTFFDIFSMVYILFSFVFLDLLDILFLLVSLFVVGLEMDLYACIAHGGPKKKK